MTTLWLKFPDEALSAQRFNDADQQKLDAVFSCQSGTAWDDTLKLLGLKGSSAPLLKWFSDCPYINWTEITRLISGGTLVTVKASNGNYALKAHYTFRTLMRLLSAQWSMTRFLHRPLTHTGTLAESLALGIALQSLIMRLGGDMERIAGLLSAIPQSAPRDRKLLEQIQSIQMHRTGISHVWQAVLPKTSGDEVMTMLPDFFWDDEAPVFQKVELQAEQTGWKGLAVCAGKITGLAVIVDRSQTVDSLADLKKKYNAPLILVFRNARPQSVEFFLCADALLFAEGGMLSHACTIAREMNIPSVTGLGTGFFTEIEAHPKLWLTLDGQAGTVNKIG